MNTKLPEITEEDRKFLHYNPNTDDLVLWVYGYAAMAIALTEADRWQPIETAPRNTPIILANFSAKCLLSGAPHVWTARYATDWVDAENKPVDSKPMWLECSYAATNENGEPTHWMPLPQAPNV